MGPDSRFSRLASYVRRTPWWALSAGAHLMVIAAAGVIGFSTAGPSPPPPGPTTVTLRSAAAPPLIPPSPHEKLIQRGQLPPSLFDDRKVPEGDHVAIADPLSDLEDGGTGTPFLELAQGEGGRRMTPGPLTGLVDVLGVGSVRASAGSGTGKRGKKALRLPPSGADTDAVMAGLRWLARHQEADGRWSGAGFAAACGGGSACPGPGPSSHDAGLTGLAVLAFLGAGFVPSSTGSTAAFEDQFQPGRRISFGETVRRGLFWLRGAQDAEGCFGPRDGEFLYDHAIATLAMAEAARLAGGPLFHDPAQRGVDFLLLAQNPGWAWRYGVRPGENDTSVTGWCVMALESAELSGLRVDRAAYDGVKRWLTSATGSNGKVGYQSPGDAGSFMSGVNDAWLGHPTMTAVGLLLKIFLDQKRTEPWKRAAAQTVARDLPLWDSDKKTVDSYYWYYGTLALYAYDGPDGPAWKSWNQALKKSLLPFQESRADRCTVGSWDPAPDKWGRVGGRIYTTALNVLTLEVYYRYASVFVGRR